MSCPLLRFRDEISRSATTWSSSQSSRSSSSSHRCDLFLTARTSAARSSTRSSRPTNLLTVSVWNLSPRSLVEETAIDDVLEELDLAHQILEDAQLVVGVFDVDREHVACFFAQLGRRQEGHFLLFVQKAGSAQLLAFPLEFVELLVELALARSLLVDARDYGAQRPRRAAGWGRVYTTAGRGLIPTAALASRGQRDRRPWLFEHDQLVAQKTGHQAEDDELGVEPHVQPRHGGGEVEPLEDARQATEHRQLSSG